LRRHRGALVLPILRRTVRGARPTPAVLGADTAPDEADSDIPVSGGPGRGR
jgi:hypothetical protein